MTIDIAVETLERPAVATAPITLATETIARPDLGDRAAIDARPVADDQVILEPGSLARLTFDTLVQRGSKFTAQLVKDVVELGEYYHIDLVSRQTGASTHDVNSILSVKCACDPRGRIRSNSCPVPL